MDKVTCPACGKKTLNLVTVIKEIPHFGKVLLLSAFCENCKFKHADVFTVEQKEPSCYKVVVESEEDLTHKIIRSSSATVEIPELGMKMEPGPASQGFITNVEGLLLRFEEVLKAQLLVADDEKKLMKVRELLEKIDEAKEGSFKFTVKVKDPLGNSAIVGPKAKKRKLRKDETKKLKHGMVIFDINNKGRANER